MSADGSGSLAVIEHIPHANGLAPARVSHSTIPIFDTARFEHMDRVARVMAVSSAVPETLRAVKVDGNLEELPIRTVMANCFLVVNQAERWGMDPFAVLQCTSMVHGKLTYEGKLVAAVLDAKLGVRLTYAWEGEGDRMKVTVSGVLPDGVIETIEGSVADWKTTGNNSPWKPATFKKMLAYRGAREWARLYAPAMMLGVYSDDEMDQLSRPPMREVNPRPTPPQIGSAPPPRAEPQTQPVAHPPRRAGPPSPPPAPRSSPPPAPSGQTMQAPPVAQAPAGPIPSAASPAAEASQVGTSSSVDDDVPPGLFNEPEKLRDHEAVLAHIADELALCGDMATLDEAWAGLDDLVQRLSRSDREKAIAHYQDAAWPLRQQGGRQ